MVLRWPASHMSSSKQKENIYLGTGDQKIIVYRIGISNILFLCFYVIFTCSGLSYQVGSGNVMIRLDPPLISDILNLINKKVEKLVSKI